LRRAKEDERLPERKVERAVGERVGPIEAKDGCLPTKMFEGKVVLIKTKKPGSLALNGS